MNVEGVISLNDLASYGGAVQLLISTKEIDRSKTQYHREYDHNYVVALRLVFSVGHRRTSDVSTVRLVTLLRIPSLEDGPRGSRTRNRRDKLIRTIPARR